MRIFGFSTGGDDKLHLNSAVHIKDGKTWIFEKNFFDGTWSESRKRPDIVRDAVFQNHFNVYADGRIIKGEDAKNACRNLFSRYFTYGEYVELSEAQRGYPLYEAMLAEKSIAAEQASKMGFHTIFDRSYNRLTLFKDYKNKNFSEILGKGNLGKRVLRHILKNKKQNISYGELKDLNWVFTSDKSACVEARNAFEKAEDVLVDIVLSSYGRFIVCETASCICEICDVFKENGKDYLSFFRSLLKYCRIHPTTIVKCPFGPSEVRNTPTRLIEHYMDYLRMYEDATEYITRHGLNEVLPKIIKPSAIRWMHDHASQYQQYLMREKSLESEISLKEDFKEIVTQPAYTELIKDSDDYQITIPSTAEDLFHEGETLSHCVAGYWKRVAKGETFIVFARKANAPDDPFFTGEVRPVHDNGKFVLVQFYGKHNTINTDKKLRSFIKSWAKEKHIKIGCAV